MISSKVVSHFRVVESIGRGGMGEVFLADDTILGRRVALKFLTSRESGQERDRILKEARSAAAIDHPYVCKVFETGEFEGQSYIVMEYVEGETLDRRMKSGPVPWNQALQIASEISEALAEAHGKGIIHRDLKPSNVMIERSGHVKLMDFGIAKSFLPRVLAHDDKTPEPTLTTGIAGTLAYMAPEQARGDRLDARADVFALGIIFFEMLTAVHPFRKGTQVATIGAILYEEAPDIRQYLPSAAAPLIRILARALARNPDDRYKSAAEFGAEVVALRENERPRTAPELPVIAILPFQDLSPQRDQEYFCDGLAEELIVALSRIDRLRVVSRSAAFQFRNTTASLGEVGKALRAKMVLEGSVRKAGERLRIVVNLVDLESGCPVWSEKYDRRLDDIFEVQDQIAAAIAGKLRVTFHMEPAAATHNIRAYELYLKGRHFWNKRTEENLRLSVGEFEKALAEDPAYALAWAGIADAWVTLSLYGAVRPREVMPIAKDAVDRALAIHPELAEALMTRGCIRAIFDFDWRGAEQDFRTSIRLNPGSAQAHQWFAMNCLAPQGRFDEAADELILAAELEPVSLAIATSIGILDFFRGDYNGAVRRFLAVLELDAGFYLACYFLGQARAETGMYDEAIRELDRAVVLADESSESLAALAYAQAAAGYHSKSFSLLEKLKQRQAVTYVSPVLIAMVQAGLQLADDAIENLESALRLRATDLIWLAVRPAFASMRSEARVARIIAATGLQLG